MPEGGSLRDVLFPFVHYEYGEAYFGSLGGLRFRIAREPLENVHFAPAEKKADAVLRATVWPEPLGYAATPREQRTEKDFPFTEEGLQQAAEWIGSMPQTRPGSTDGNA